jgi:hypothetical protein
MPPGDPGKTTKSSYSLCREDDFEGKRRLPVSMPHFERDFAIDPVFGNLFAFYCGIHFVNVNGLDVLHSLGSFLYHILSGVFPALVGVS